MIPAAGFDDGFQTATWRDDFRPMWGKRARSIDEFDDVAAAERYVHENCDPKDHREHFPALCCCFCAERSARFLAASDRLIIDQPDEALRLIQGWMILVGDPKPWWKATALADDPAWPRAIRSAIVDVARTAGVEPKTLAEFLDLQRHPFTKTRARIMRMATERLDHDRA